MRSQGAHHHLALQWKRPVLGVQRVTALTEADGSEKSHLCSISIPLSFASGLPCACQLLMQHWFTLDSREVSWRKATVYWGQNSREGKSNSSSVMPTSALWSTRRSRLGESRPLRVFSNGPMAMFPGKQMKWVGT